MKIIHISDLHIGKTLYKYSLADDQRYALHQIVEYAQKYSVDAIVIAGDIYDKSIPSAEAVAIFDDFLTELSLAMPELTIFLISGNHDSGDRIEFASKILKKHNIIISGNPPMDEGEAVMPYALKDEYGEVNFYLLPFTKPAHVRAFFSEGEKITYSMAIDKLIRDMAIDSNKRNILVSHQFYVGSTVPITCDSEFLQVGGLDMVDVNILEAFDYVALGHIHKAQYVNKEEIRYSGSLLKYSVSERDHKKTISLVEFLEKGNRPIIEELEIKPLRELKLFKGNLEDILSNAQKDDMYTYVSIILTDENESIYAKERLEEIYKNILEINIDNSRTRKLKENIEELADIEDITPIGVWKEFFEQMNSRAMTEDEEAAVEEVLERIFEEGNNETD